MRTSCLRTHILTLGLALSGLLMACGSQSKNGSGFVRISLDVAPNPLTPALSFTQGAEDSRTLSTCYALNVMGPGIPALDGNTNRCGMYSGILTNAVSGNNADGTEKPIIHLDAVVPTGTGRIVQVIGMDLTAMGMTVDGCGRFLNQCFNGGTPHFINSGCSEAITISSIRVLASSVPTDIFGNREVYVNTSGARSFACEGSGGGGATHLSIEIAGTISTSPGCRPANPITITARNAAGGVVTLVSPITIAITGSGACAPITIGSDTSCSGGNPTSIGSGNSSTTAYFSSSCTSGTFTINVTSSTLGSSDNLNVSW